MKRKLFLAAGTFALATAVIAAGPVFTRLSLPSASAQVTTTQSATVRTAVFAVENMTCALCPVTVRTAMERVNGVRSVAVDFAAKTATVVFDPSVTTLEAIGAASTNAGYPASAAS
jgi:mercuric ion binding protein